MTPTQNKQLYLSTYQQLYRQVPKPPRQTKHPPQLQGFPVAKHAQHERLQVPQRITHSPGEPEHKHFCMQLAKERLQVPDCIDNSGGVTERFFD